MTRFYTFIPNSISNFLFFFFSPSQLKHEKHNIAIYRCLFVSFFRFQKNWFSSRLRFMYSVLQGFRDNDSQMGMRVVIIGVNGIISNCGTIPIIVPIATVYSSLLHLCPNNLENGLKEAHYLNMGQKAKES